MYRPNLVVIAKSKRVGLFQELHIILFHIIIAILYIRSLKLIKVDIISYFDSTIANTCHDGSIDSINKIIFFLRHLKLPDVQQERQGTARCFGILLLAAATNISTRIGIITISITHLTFKHTI